MEPPTIQDMADGWVQGAAGKVNAAAPGPRRHRAARPGSGLAAISLARDGEAGLDLRAVPTGIDHGTVMVLCKGRGFCGAMGNDDSWVSVVDLCRGSLVRARVGARRGTEAILLHWPWWRVWNLID